MSEAQFRDLLRMMESCVYLASSLAALIALVVTGKLLLISYGLLWAGVGLWMHPRLSPTPQEAP